MEPHLLKRLLEELQAGDRSVDSAMEQLAQVPYADMGFAKVDHHRKLRCGFSEVIFGAGKNVQDTVAIARQTLTHADVVLVTRTTSEQAEALLTEFPTAHHNERAKTVRMGTPETSLGGGTALVVSAGTSDLPVAEEALETLQAFGAHAESMCDVGVAGLHRLLHNMPRLRTADVAVVVAGMEGALPSVIGGMVSCPVIAVPTSVGYGASFGGVAALLSMLNSCASGVSVVNIDNGFGGAAAALRILRQLHEKSGPRKKDGDPFLNTNEGA